MDGTYIYTQKSGKYNQRIAREVLAGGDRNIPILLMDGKYIYIQKSVKYINGDHHVC